jgi:hypothetical protein
MLGALHGEEKVAGSGFADGVGLEAAVRVELVEGSDVGGFEADVKEADGVSGLDVGIEFNELAVVDFDEGLGGDAIFIEGEGLLEA